MNFLQLLRNRPWLARWLLLSWTLSLGAAVATPMVQPRHEVMICSVSGMVTVLLNEDGTVASTELAGKSCPLCVLPGVLPAPQQPPIGASTQVIGRVSQGIAFSHVVALTAPPLPSRGPPEIS